MSPIRSLKNDLAAIGLCVLVVFLALALVSYDPADPVTELSETFGQIYPADVLVYPANERVANLAGHWGAIVAHLLLTGLGIGSYYLVASLGVLDWQLLRRRVVTLPTVRLLGWAVSLVGLTASVAIVLPWLSPGPVVGAGGYLGALGRALLQTQFATAGGVILSLSLLVGGLLISTDYALVGITRAVCITAFVGSAAAMKWARRDKTKPAQNTAEQVDESAADPMANADVNADAEPIANADPNAELVPIKVRKKPAGDLTAKPVPAAANSVASKPGVSDMTKPSPVTKAVAPAKKPEVHSPAKAPAPPALNKEVPAVASDDAVDESRDEGADTTAQRHDAAHESPKPRRMEKAEREKVMASLNQATDYPEPPQEYRLPELQLLTEGTDTVPAEQEQEVRRKAKILEKTFADFGFKVKVVEIETGPVIAQYEVELEAGLRLSKITGLADDLAIALRVPSVRIVAPIPGKNTVGIEIPNETRQVVRLREVIEEANEKTKSMRIPLFLGKDVSGNPLIVDLSTLPHLLIAGRTGTGKSVCLNAIISSILMTRKPDEVRMLMIDPKMVELSCYGRLPHLMHPVVTDMRKAEAILAWAVEKMEERYALLARAGVRHISSFNQLGQEELERRLKPEDDAERAAIPTHLPFIVIVADEMADLMMTAGKEVEQHIIRLAQKSRAVGIHLILATQKPTVDVITGLIKSNLPARIAFQVASRTDSRVVLDEMGADKLLGNGDMLFLWPGTSTLLRGQGTYLSDDEINRVVDAVSVHEQEFVNELVNIRVTTEGGPITPGQLKKRDELYEQAVEVVIREGRGSVSLLQRALGIGYGRAARLIDFMAEDRIVGDYNGSQAREVVISLADWERMKGGGESEPEEESQIPVNTKPKRSNKVRPTSSAVGTPSAEGTPSEERRRGRLVRQEDVLEDDFETDENDDAEYAYFDDSEDDAFEDEEGRRFHAETA